MPMYRLKMAAFLVMLSVAPATAANQPAAAKHDRSACPQHRARTGASAGAPAAVVTWQRKAAPRTVIVKSSGGGLGTWGQIAADLMP